MMHKQPHNDTTIPPGQIINKIPNLEMPLTRAVEAFQGEQIEGLVRRVHQLENELKYVRDLNTRLYLENKGLMATYKETQKEFWKGIDKNLNV